MNSNNLNSPRRAIKTSEIEFNERNLNMLIENLILTFFSAHFVKFVINNLIFKCINNAFTLRNIFKLTEY